MKHIRKVSLNYKISKPAHHSRNNSQFSLSFTRSSLPKITSQMHPDNTNTFIFHYQQNPTFHCSIQPVNTSVQPDRKLFRASKSKLLSNKVPTPNENKEIKKIIENKVKNQILKAKIRLNKKVESMNKIGVVSTKANQVRGMSLLSIESSIIERKIPNYKRIATSEVLMKRCSEKMQGGKNSRSEVLDKIKSILLRDYEPGSEENNVGDEN